VLTFSEMEDEDDEETQEWEMAQVKRAGGWKEEEPEKPTKASYQPTPSKSARLVATNHSADDQCHQLVHYRQSHLLRVVLPIRWRS
jgi:GC-rich sequence DNA-binding factor